MNIDQFWAIIEPGKDDEEPAEGLRDRLDELDPKELESFQQHFDALFDRAYRWPLWGAAYLIEGGCSDDGFMDFRYALISKGRTIYEAALAEPDSLVDVSIVSDELYGYVAQEAYEAKTGQSIPRREVTSSREPAGERWDFDDLDENRKRLPRITARFAE